MPNRLVVLIEVALLFVEETQLLSKRVCSFLLAVILAGSCSVLPASAQQAGFANEEILRTTVPNFGVVPPTLIGGGLPGQHGIQALKNSGVKTVINLMNPGKLSDDEKELVERNNMKYVTIPMSHFKAATKDQMDKFLSVVNNPESQPVFVHGHQGQDRTGTMVAVYRINHEGWTASKAYDEMVNYGFHPFFVKLTSSVFALASAAGRPEQAPGFSFIYGDLKSRFKRAVSLQ